MAGSDAVCPSGTRVIGGGFGTGKPGAEIDYAAIVSSSTYRVVGVNYWSTASTIQAQAVCVSGPGIPALSIQGSSMEADTILQRLQAELEAR